MEIYGIENLNELKEGLFKEQEAFLSYFEALMTKGTRYFIENINCEVKILKTGNILIPLAITDSNYDDSLYVSMLSHYIKYTEEEFNKNNLKFGFLFKVLEYLFIKNKVNKTIYVNQWFISTNLYPELNLEQIKQITDFLKTEYKDYAIIFKNITKEYNSGLYENLNRQGYKEIISRQIFIKDKKKEISSKQKTKIKKDLKFYHNSPYKAYKIQKTDDFKRIKNIYTMLYIGKYSKYNPKYTQDYFKLAGLNPIFNLTVFKNEEKINSMCLTVSKDNILKDENITKSCCLMYDKYHKIFNMSAGIGDFKMQRGAKAYFEYLMIYYNHLPILRRIMFSFLKFSVNKIIPILCKHKLCGFI